MEILRLCPTLSDIHLICDDYSLRYIDLRSPLPLSVFSAQSSSVWWSNISTIHFSIRWTLDEWLRLKSMLAHFGHLKSLSLELFLNDQRNQVEFPDGLAENGSVPNALPQFLDSLTFEIRADPHPHPGCKF